MNQRYHLLGIEGVGMNALAEALSDLGAQVSGCDLSPGANARRLAENGILVFKGHDPAHLEAADRLVVTSAAPEDHPEIQAARRRGLPVERRIETLARVLAARESFGVSGSHGKTTTTAMLAEVLAAAGKDPMALVGARVPGWRGGYRPGSGPIVAEIDESDRRFPLAAVKLAVVTNLEEEHVGDASKPTYHASFEDLKEAMARWLAAAEMVVHPAGDATLAPLLPPRRATLSFGIDRGEIRAERVELLPRGTRFELWRADERVARIGLQVPGEHNVKNALAAAAAGFFYGLAPEAVAAGLEAFRGTGRRFERVGSYRGAWLFDDYAHHPTEIAATLKAARGLGRRVRAVFQPHRYLRTARFFDAFAEALALADEAIVLDVYAAGEAPIEGVSGAALAERARAKGANVQYLAKEEALRYLAETLKEDEVLVTLGAGDVGTLARTLADPEKATP